MRLGILGGTFNPIHTGHLILAEEARAAFALDRCLFIPNALPPHKEEPSLASAEHRLAMVRLAIDGHPVFEASELEIARGGRSYTVDTLEALRHRYGPTVELFFLVGSDACGGLAHWKSMDRVMQLCHVVVAHRPGYRVNVSLAGVRLLEIPALDVSSTAIRQRLQAGRSIRYLVPEAVYHYLLTRQLYAAPNARAANP
ncbi:MAG: nicotinate-nucleotide adenylyltransferase [Candidatus Omnitrophica bacterium]|nr:nicotinate-nucleotide adenylyltransferase [Candidatus Omnitrophota bacterium]